MLRSPFATVGWPVCFWLVVVLTPFAFPFVFVVLFTPYHAYILNSRELLVVFKICCISRGSAVTGRSRFAAIAVGTLE